jgi:DDE superfamily endonuclease
MGRKRCRSEYEVDLGPPSSPRKPGSAIRTPRRVRILAACDAFQGRVPQPIIFAHHGVSETAGKAILRSGASRTSGKRQCKQKRKLGESELAIIETFENASFRHATQRHFIVAQHLGFKNISERTVQRLMSEYGVGTYTAAQQKAMTPERCRERVTILGQSKYRTRRYWRRFGYSDECHWGLGPMKRAKVHRRKGSAARYTLNKIQTRRKRQVQRIHVFGVVWHSTNPDKPGKSRLRFYTGTGKKGAMLKADYEAILTDTVAVDMPIGPRGKVLLEDNHHSHGHAPGSTLHHTKATLGIKFHANIPTSPDLNVIEKIWRVMKQRIKARGHPKGINELRGWIQAEWDAIDQELINRYIDDMQYRAVDICRRGGGLLPY